MSEYLRRRQLDSVDRGPTVPTGGSFEDQPLEAAGAGGRTMRTPGLRENGDGSRTETDRRPWEERLSEALEVLNEYKAGKTSLEQRVIEAERYYRQHNWAGKRGDRKKYGTRTNSGWLFNSCMIKHADAMDNFPEPNVLPRESSDEATAKQLTEVIPCVLELNDYEELYDRGWWDKIVKGTSVTCVSWDESMSGGLGDINISRTDILNVFWDTACADIQDSRNLFCVAMVDNKQLEEEYGDKVRDKLSSPTFTPGRYAYETTHNDAGRSAVIDWYYKRNGILHYCKFVGNIVLYASEDDERYRERGYYDHGLYPFVFDTLYPMEGSPAGFGQVDLCRDSQDYIDRLDSAILDSALINSRPKYFLNNAGGVNHDELLDPEQPVVHVNGAGAIGDSVVPFAKSELNALYVQIEQNKIMELRETSGSTAAAQGGAAAGVTAYSAIAAMQEAASKPSRDLIRAGYRAYKQICYLMIELMRQFYNAPRMIRITGTGDQPEYMAFDNSGLMPQAQPGVLGTEFSERLPVFDIKVRPAKQTAYSRMAQNELAKELYAAGMFAPQNSDAALAVLDMMQFEGKDKVVDRVRENGTLMQMVQQMAMQLQQMQMALGALTGAAPMQPPAAGGPGTTSSVPPAGGPPSPEGKAEPGANNDSLGKETQTGKRITAPRERAQNANSVG